MASSLISPFRSICVRVRDTVSLVRPRWSAMSVRRIGKSNRSPF